MDFELCDISDRPFCLMDFLNGTFSFESESVSLEPSQFSESKFKFALSALIKFSCDLRELLSGHGLLRESIDETLFATLIWRLVLPFSFWSAFHVGYLSKLHFGVHTFLLQCMVEHIQLWNSLAGVLGFF